MAKIAIVDDSNDQRDTYKKRLSLFLKQKGSTLTVIDTCPLPTYDLYNDWIVNEDIVALIFDEKLNIESQKGCVPVDYKGSELVKKIRERFKDMPIFTLTNFPDDDELMRNFNQFEFILSKSDFSLEHVDIIIRACQRYFDENQKQLSLFNDVTIKVASGEATIDDINKLKALQIKLHIPIGVEIRDRQDWLKEYETQIDFLEKIKVDLENKLNM